MSKKAIRKKEKIFSQENVTGFKKDKKTGKYRIISQSFQREQVSGDIKPGEKKESEDLFEIATAHDFDHKFSYIDNDTEMNIFLKKCDEKSS